MALLEATSSLSLSLNSQSVQEIRYNVDKRVAEIIFHSSSLQWILDKQDLLKERQKDLKFLTEEEYWKLQIFFTNGKAFFYFCHKICAMCHV